MDTITLLWGSEVIPLSEVYDFLSKFHDIPDKTVSQWDGNAAIQGLGFTFSFS